MTRWKHRTVRLARPFLNRGVPSDFRRYDLPFLEWLARTGRDVDVLAQADVEASSARELARAYDLIVSPGHHEYVTTREYDAIEGCRDLGGNLALVGEPFGNREGTVWASFEPRRMQPRKEVDNMHVALIRSRAANTLVALLAAVAFATAFAPVIDQGGDSRPEPSIMPGSICPPVC